MSSKVQPKGKEGVKRLSLIFWFIYLVQKFTNHFEGFSKIPVRKLLKSPEGEGGFGLGTDQAGHFISNSAIGWYIKALLGFITDRIPILGYRRKSWLILSLVGSGFAWLYVAATGTTSSQALFAGLVIVNILVAFSDVVADGLMVQKGQELERNFGMKEGTGNRPLQTAQWIGAFTAILFAAIAGGVIAQLFDIKIAAILSAALPFGLAIIIFFFVGEEKVKFEWKTAKVGFAAIAVIVVVAFLILWLKGLRAEDVMKDNVVITTVPGWEKFIAGWEWLISPLLILGAILSLYRPPTALVWPIVLIVLWQANPFNVDSQWFYQYFTQDNGDFLTALKENTGLVPFLQDLVVSLKLASTEELAKAGFQEIFFGSVIAPIQAVFSIIGLILFYKYWRATSLIRVFTACIVLNAISIGMFALVPMAGITSPYYVLAAGSLAGFPVALSLIAVLTYAAGICPKENQATAFAFLMGMSNLGQVLGVERLGSKLYTIFGDQTEKLVDGKLQQVIENPAGGMISMSLVGLASLVFLLFGILWMHRRGHINQNA